jgi:predicted aconitase with swiveling domain
MPEAVVPTDAKAAARTMSGRQGFGQRVQGRVLVSRHAFSPRYDLDRSSGIISRAAHDLEGQSVAGMVLVVPAAKGGVAAGWAMYDLKQRGVAPLAMVFTTVNPVFVQGCVFADIPILAGLSPDPVRTLASGEVVEVDPGAGHLIRFRTPTAFDEGLGRRC